MAFSAGTFAKPAYLYTGASFVMAGSVLFRIRPNSNTKQVNITIPASQCSGFGFMGKYAYTVDFVGTDQVYRYDLAASSGGVWLNIPFDTANDVACDGTYVYMSGIDSGDASTDFRVAKYSPGGVQQWNNAITGYNGGAVHIAANPDGFIAVNNARCRIYDTSGSLVANRDSDMLDNSGFQWASCATRDRFWVADKTAASGGTVKIYQYNSATGARVQTITPTDLSLDQTGLISATEEALYYWLDQGGGSNHRVRIYSRTVTRDGDGVITGDTISSTGTLVDFGTTTTENQFKAATNADTYLTY